MEKIESMNLGNMKRNNDRCEGVKVIRVQVREGKW